MDWIANNWNQVSSYNFGTGITGLAVFSLAAYVYGRLHPMGRLLATVLMGFGAYFIYRGFYWFGCSVMTYADHLYHPACTSSPAHPDDWRWTIWLVIVPLELVLMRLYWHVFGHREAAFALCALIITSYVAAGFF